MFPTKKINDKISRFNDQFFYSEKVGAYLINLPDKIVLFDIPTYSGEVEKYLLSLKKPLIALLSHGPCGIADGSAWQQKTGMVVHLHEDDKNSEWLRMKPDFLFSEPPKISKDLEIILTPGHTAGSICLLEKTTKTLFTGDTFGGGGDNEVWDFFKNGGDGDLKQRLKSCKKLLGYDFDSALPFHYDMILNHAKSSLKRFVDKYS